MPDAARRLGPGGGDPFASATVWLAAGTVTAVFLWVLGDLAWHGAGQLSADFLTAAPRDAGRAGGVGPILVSTALILAVCLAAAVPIALGTAVLLAEFCPAAGVLGRLVRRSLDVLAGVPSIVFGLFGNVFFCDVLGLGFSILSGGLTLSCMVLPLLIRSVEESLRAVPDEHRLGAAALGISRASALRHVLLPAAAPGLVIGLVLGIGRALAETAALLYTSGYVDRLPSSLMDSGRSLSIHIYDLSMNVAGGSANAYTSALVLVGLLLISNIAVSSIADRWLGRRISWGTR